MYKQKILIRIKQNSAIILKGVAFIPFILGIAIEGICQDVQYSQFYSVPLQLSPSFAGSSGGQRMYANYRNQWPGIAHSFETYTISYDRYFSKIKSGVGVSLLRDRKGELSLGTTSVCLSYSYDFRILNKVHIRPGIVFQYDHESLNTELIRTRMQILNPAFTSPEPFYHESLGYFDAGTSFLVYNSSFWLGTTVNHLAKPYFSLGRPERMPMRFNIYSGLRLRPKGRMLKPENEHLFLTFQFRQMAEFNQLDIGILGHKENFNLGLGYRGIPFTKNYSGNDAIIVILGYSAETYSIGFSYDITVSGLRDSSNGAVEISAIYCFSEPQARKRHGMVPCPGF